MKRKNLHKQRARRKYKTDRQMMREASIYGLAFGRRFGPLKAKEPT